MSIKFGTDGWRGLMSADFTVNNVRVVAQAIADYVASRGLARYGVVVGYDSRRGSKEYAKACAEVLAGNGVPVYMTATDVPTPLVAFATVRLRAGGAVMITASHNPPDYNGIKFIPHYGGPASAEITQEIEKLIAQAEVRASDMEEADRRGLVAYVDFREEYLDWISSLVDRDAIQRARLRVLVNPLHGSVAGILDEALGRLGCEVKRMRCEKDPAFGGLTPDPTLPESVQDMQDFMEGVDVGLATDGDGDRAAAYSESHVTPNTLFPILLRHMLEKGVRGGVVRTVATTHMVDEIATKNGLRVYEVPVGFKNIAPHLLMGEAIMGGEESGGFGYKWHIPEKDGVLTCLYLVEALALSGKRRIEELVREVSKEIKIMYSVRGKVEVDRPQEVRGLLADLEPRSIGGLRVKEVIRIDGAKFITERGWVLIRPSGTEPVVRVYAESEEPKVAESLLAWGLKELRKLAKAR
ncbi:MAG: phosphoglucomutase/phosphomannomutase family protein [Candidatus Verstraetearchaeota archaeon]|nr:phosphoglucomutase/phosphomannomutase family protein [Candidatus Verstraetearchaeota archaeon]